MHNGQLFTTTLHRLTVFEIKHTCRNRIYLLFFLNERYYNYIAKRKKINQTFSIAPYIIFVNSVVLYVLNMF